MAEAPATRRRFLAILASAATMPCGRVTADDALEWRGTALGADARILLAGKGRAPAQEVVAECLDEIDRLDRIFSLYRPDSELVTLNANGKSDDVSLDLRHVLAVSVALNRLSGGLFDPTVQPLWRLYADWYAGRPNRRPLPAAVIKNRIASIGIGRVHCEGSSVRLPAGASLTFNGIAQGYITDRVTDILRARGWRHVLADIGEVRAIGGKPDGQSHSIRIQESGLDLTLTDAALATSSPDQLVFAPAEGLAHVLHPRTGSTASPWACVTVQHASAMVADGLSTALVLATPSMVAAIVRRGGAAKAWLTARNGSTVIVEG